jgi:hypothetical protein
MLVASWQSGTQNGGFRNVASHSITIRNIVPGARDRQAVPQGPHRRLRESRRHQVRIGLFAGASGIRTLSPP